MNKKRLLKLADLLEADAANPAGIKFDLGVWATFENEPKIDCGTTACAVGLACLSDTFNEEGLVWNGVTEEPKFNGYRGWPAVRLFFDLDREDTDFLFVDESYEVEDNRAPNGAEGELAVAKRIRNFVAGKSQP